ncbi:MAG: pseudouridine synthase [Kiritimatiellaeota bacterium]|nr:pseudouridine synthase [Kiritimatiellota bacterium]
MLTDITFAIDHAEAGQRIDRVLAARFPTSTRAFCREAVALGDVRLNGAACLKGAKAQAGEVVSVIRLAEARDNRVQPDPSLAAEVVFEDNGLIAVSKPAGQPVHPLSWHERGTLMNGLVARYPELAGVGDQPLMAGALHRIDTGTSGLVLVARTDAMFAFLRAQFAAQAVDKIYLALVEGRVDAPARLAHHLAHHPSSRGKMVDARSLAAPGRRLFAKTAYRPVERIGGYTLLEVSIRTGVTHQIRCQLALGGHPVVNDILYGARPVLGCTRHFLHAARATILLPDGLPFALSAPLTPDFAAFLMRCRGK